MKKLDLPVTEDMRAYHAERNTIKLVEIAERQLDVLRGFWGPRDNTVPPP